MANNNSKPRVTKQLDRYDRERQAVLMIALTKTDREARKLLELNKREDRKMDRRLVAQGVTPPMHA